MTAFTGNGYLVTDIASLTAIPAIDRPAFKVALLVAGLGWYEYDNAATTGGIVPNDNPVNGRWFSIGREVLRANRTYFVRTDGSDSNTGLTNTSGGAFLTILKAVSTAINLDANGFTVTISIQSGTYNLSDSVVLPKNYTGTFILQGDVNTPSNVVVQASASWTTRLGLFQVDGSWKIEGLRIQSSTFTGGALVAVGAGGFALLGNNIYGIATNTNHILAYDSGAIEVVSNYSIIGGSSRHLWSNVNSSIRCQSRTITISNTPAFISAFCVADYQGIAVINGCTFTGSATGARYIANDLGQIIAFGGANYLPGNTAGTVSGGFYY